MIKKIGMRLALLVALAVGMTMCQDAQGDVQSLVRTKQVDHSWRFVCKWSGYSCEGIEPPNVVWTQALVNSQWALGFYIPGEPNVYIGTKYMASTTQTVLVHEMTHYLQDVLELGMTMCEMEGDAFRVSDRYAQRNDHPNLVRGENWHEAYPNCGPSS
jgi:hypothetical protein